MRTLQGWTNAQTDAQMDAWTEVTLNACRCVKKNPNQYNKRAQRALGRSPEEKVKGHSGANNREPQGHNLNNFGRGPFDDVIY